MAVIHRHKTRMNKVHIPLIGTDRQHEARETKNKNVLDILIKNCTDIWPLKRTYNFPKRLTVRALVVMPWDILEDGSRELRTERTAAPVAHEPTAVRVLQSNACAVEDNTFYRCVEYSCLSLNKIKMGLFGTIKKINSSLNYQFGKKWMNTIAITPLQKVQREASKILSPDQPAGRGSLAAVEINGFHFIVCDDNELPFSSRLLGQLHVHDRDWPVEHADFLNDDGVDRTAKSEKNIRKR